MGGSATFSVASSSLYGHVCKHGCRSVHVHAVFLAFFFNEGSERSRWQNRSRKIGAPDMNMAFRLVMTSFRVRRMT